MTGSALPAALERAFLGTYALGTGLLAKRARWVWEAGLTLVGRLWALSMGCGGRPALLTLQQSTNRMLVKLSTQSEKQRGSQLFWRLSVYKI